MQFTSELPLANDQLRHEAAIRRSVKRDLHHSEDRYRQMVEGAEDLIYSLTPDGRFTFVNAAAAGAVNRSVEECLGMHFLSFIRADFREQALKFYQGQIKERAPLTYFELPMKSEDNEEEIWIGQNVQLVIENSEVVELQAVGRDITQRKQIERQLLESEKRYRLLFESNPQPMWVFDRETLRFLAVNDAAVIQYGYTREEFLGMTIKNIRPEEDLNALVNQKANSIDGFGSYDDSCRWRHRRKDGSILDVEITWHKIEFAGQPAKLVLARDVTERRRAEAEIRFQQSRFQQLFKDAPLGILQVDRDDRIVDANKEFLSIFQYKLSEIKGLHINETIVPAEDVGEASHLSASTMRGEAFRAEALRRRKDGSLVSVEIFGVPIMIDQRVVGVFAIYMDLTSRKRADDERQLISEIIQGVINTSDLNELLTSIHRAISKYLYAENCFVALYDEETKLMQFPFWVDKFDPRPEPRPIGIGFSSYVLRTGKPMLVNPELTELMYQRGEVEKSGSKSASWMGVPLRTSERWIGALVVQHYEEENAYDQRDLEFLTSVGNQIALAIERKRAETHLREAEDRLRQSQKMESIGSLAGGIAHDFNNLMTAVTGYSELALKSLGEDDSLRFKIEEIKKAGERATSLTRQLLAFSRKQMLQPRVLDLNKIIFEMDKMLRRLIGEDMMLEALLEPALGQVKADPGQIEQVLMNLVVNARDAMPTGGKLTIETRNAYFDQTYIKPQEIVQPGHYVVLAVSDEGHGMDTQTQQKIFEPFFTTKEVGRGTGLGLATVYGIVKQSDGYIWVYSEPDKGTTFKIYLPRVDHVRDLDNMIAVAEPVASGDETVLLVEDEQMVRDLAKEVLKQYGYTVVCAANGEEGLRVCKEFEGRIDLVITDVVMPHMSGRELAEQIATLRPDTRVLYMSGFTDDAIVRHGLLHEGFAFIQKPFSPQSLAMKARELLDR